MTCEACQKDSGFYDTRKLCCAARFVEYETRTHGQALMARMMAEGHREADLRAGIAEIRRKRGALR